MALRCPLDRMIQKLRAPQLGSFLVAQRLAQMMLVEAHLPTTAIRRKGRPTTDEPDLNCLSVLNWTPNHWGEATCFSGWDHGAARLGPPARHV